MCVLSIKVPIRKKVWKLIVCPSYIYIYIYNIFVVGLKREKYSKMSRSTKRFAFLKDLFIYFVLTQV